MSPLSFVGTATLNLRYPYHFGLISTAIAFDTLHDSMPGTICTLHPIPCDSVQRRLLSIKMAFFMDRVCKIICCPRKGLFLWIGCENVGTSA